jgi:chlorobactene glucosyltransferase
MTNRSPVSWLTHLCASIALAFVFRAAKFAPSWFEIPVLARAPELPLPKVSILVPARNEERSIERCVRSLATQRFVDAEVIVVDDRSTDATRDILERLAFEFSHVRVVRGEELPEGWVGKPWALHQGVLAARGEWFLFTDADSVHEPAGVASALAFTLAARADALSIVTRQELGTFWERATLPFILGLIFYASGTLAQLNDPLQTERVLANGQYILVARVAHEALGGHAALRGEIVEDVEFARRLKADGHFRLLLGGGTRLASVRMYHSLPEIWRGFTKNVFMGAKGNVAVLFGAAAFMFLLSASPWLALRAVVRRRPYEALEASAAAAACIVTSWRGIAMVGMAPSTAVFQPLGTAFFGAIILNSTFRVLSGRGVEWRGRRYSGRPTSNRDPAA